jgi:hypothetical protein
MLIRSRTIYAPALARLVIRVDALSVDLRKDCIITPALM